MRTAPSAAKYLDKLLAASRFGMELVPSVQNDIQKALNISLVPFPRDRNL